MKINTALILCAGLGKRLNPITLNTPKPLLKIKDVSMLERCINLIEKLGIQKIFINTFYLKDQFSKFLDKKNFNLDINIIEDGKHILDTGGGIQNMVKDCDENNFLVFNPDTFWSNKYLEEIQNMEKFYFANKLKDILLVVEKSKSFDQRMNGDFSLQNNILTKLPHKNFIFTGCQILNKSIFENHKIETFSINNIWEEMILKKQLYGYKSELEFTHLTDMEIYGKLSKI